MTVSVDVLMVNYLTPDLAQASAERLAGDGVSIYIWDNSGDLPSQLGVPGVRVAATGQNIYYAEASNQLYNMSSSPLVLLLNPDVELHPSQLARLTAALLDDEAAWGSAPRLVSRQGADQHYVRRVPTASMVVADRVPATRRFLRRADKRYWYADLDREIDAYVEQPAAACLLLRRDKVGEVLFDPAYPLFFNDTDLARRMLKTGRCRYLGSLSVTHVGGESITRLADRAWIRREYDRSYLLYCRRNLRAWPALALIFALRRLAMGLCEVQSR